MTSKDPYQILGVSRTATQDEIKRAYRRLAKAHHPDRNPNDPQAEQRFKEVQAAYEVLGDAEKRAQFDQFGAGGPRPNVREWSVGGSPFEDVRVDFGSLGDLTSIFEQFFNRGARPRRRPRTRPPDAPPGPNLEHDVTVTFDEALRGTSREVVLSNAEQPGETERISFRVPAGVTDGQRIRVRGQGHPGPGGRGDLIIRVHVSPHPHFRREGQDLLLDLPLSIREASLGTRVDIPTLDGRTVLTVPPGTSSGTKLRLRGLGVRDARTRESGDMYAVVRVIVPRDLSPRAHELVEQLDRELNQTVRSGAPWTQS